MKALRKVKLQCACGRCFAITRSESTTPSGYLSISGDLYLNPTCASIGRLDDTDPDHAPVS